MYSILNEKSRVDSPNSLRHNGDMQEYRYALQLLLDPATEDSIGEFIETLRVRGLVNGRYIPSHYQPHLSLAVFKEMDESYGRRILPLLAEGELPIPLNFVSLGVFRGRRKVLYLGPVFSSRLWSLHVKVLEHFDNRPEQNWELYNRDVWVPHCALLIDEEWEPIYEAMKLAVHFKPEGAMADRLVLAGSRGPAACPLGG